MVMVEKGKVFQRLLKGKALARISSCHAYSVIKRSYFFQFSANYWQLCTFSMVSYSSFKKYQGERMKLQP